MTDPHPNQQAYQETMPSQPYPPQQHQPAGPSQPRAFTPTDLATPSITSMSPDQAPPLFPQGPAQRGKLPVILALGSVVALLIAVAAVVWTTSRDTLSREDAQRECRTALEREASRRAGQAGPDGILVSLTRVDLQETWETDSGFAVNGTANYTLTSVLLPQVSQSVSLTCEATAADGGVATTVKNRL